MHTHTPTKTRPSTETDRSGEESINEKSNKQAMITRMGESVHRTTLSHALPKCGLKEC